MKRGSLRGRCLVGLLGGVLGGSILAGPAVAASSVPYTDPNAVGSIGLCNAAGQALTKGGVNDVPFVTKAIDSTPAAAPYNGAGETATLFIYQPRQGILPSEWHGEQIGASSRSSTPQHPTAILTAGDGALSAALSDYPPMWNGLMQLRIYLGAPNEPIYNATYDATDIKIDGDKWQVARGDSVSCGDGQSVSLEQVLASTFPQLTTTSSPSSGAGAAAPTQDGKSGASVKPGAVTTAGANPSGSSGGAGDSAAAGAKPGASAGASSSSADSVNAADTGSEGSSGPSAVVWVLIVVGVVGVGAAAFLWWRSRPVGTRRA